MEERHKIWALLMCKEFIEKLGEKATKRHEMPDIGWRESLYVGNVQLVGSVEHSDPAPKDQFVADDNGNHTSWYVIAAAVERATGLAASELQATWQARPHVPRLGGTCGAWAGGPRRSMGFVGSSAS